MCFNCVLFSCADNGHSFDALFFSGMEFNLMIFELMMFIHLDMIFENFVLSAVFNFVLIELIKNAYKFSFRRNLVKKALVDERFLL